MSFNSTVFALSPLFSLFLYRCFQFQQGRTRMHTPKWPGPQGVSGGAPAVEGWIRALQIESATRAKDEGRAGGGMRRRQHGETSPAGRRPAKHARLVTARVGVERKGTSLARWTQRERNGATWAETELGVGTREDGVRGEIARTWKPSAQPAQQDALFDFRERLWYREAERETGAVFARADRRHEEEIWIKQAK